MYQTLKIEFNHISKHLEVPQQYPAARHIFNSVVAVWKCGQTRSFLFDNERGLDWVESNSIFNHSGDNKKQESDLLKYD